MVRRKRRKFTAEFKADAVRLVATGAKTIAAVTEEFNLRSRRYKSIGSNLRESVRFSYPSNGPVFAPRGDRAMSADFIPRA
jgi:transposase-like protein